MAKSHYGNLELVLDSGGSNETLMTVLIASIYPIELPKHRSPVLAWVWSDDFRLVACLRVLPGQGRAGLLILSIKTTQYLARLWCGTVHVNALL